MPEIPPTTAIDQAAGQSPCCDANLVLSSPPNIYECRECMRTYDTAVNQPEAQGQSEPDDVEVETCQATTSDGDPCGNPAGPDGYCHLDSHTAD